MSEVLLAERFQRLNRIMSIGFITLYSWEEIALYPNFLSLLAVNVYSREMSKWEVMWNLCLGAVELESISSTCPDTSSLYGS